MQPRTAQTRSHENTKTRRHENTKARRHETTKPRHQQGTENMRLTERSSRFRVFVPSWLRFGVGVALGLGVVLLFSPTFSYPFLNWDDGEVFVRNAALHADGF